MITLLDVTLAAAVTAEVSGPPQPVHGPIHSLTLSCDFVRDGGGTTAKAYVQTSLDGGLSWYDIACFAFTTTNARRAYVLTDAAVTSIVTPSDAALADNTAVNGLLGDQYRVKLTTTGTYTGPSTFKVFAVAK